MYQIPEYLGNEDKHPLFLVGDALNVLRQFPDESVDCCITSPPYWQKRQYENGGLGLETTPDIYIDALYKVIKEISRILKPTGAFWLNIGDSYLRKSLQAIPWRIAIRMIDSGW